ncbi:nucleotide exchange factor GrpE [Shouchella lonarensis]|uniref:Protein GrpE n=1 Tax=Shouchella lonarensis TaxID=1464122 RepID=A0A1G6KII1_9BACI|nr:nucleotide exchange factor GrpE [Shouchella lonarensis]SDC30638.1 molecular chaperone GrpE [Shouchella lonarensis]
MVEKHDDHVAHSEQEDQEVPAQEEVEKEMPESETTASSEQFDEENEETPEADPRDTALTEMEERLARVRADFENFKRRSRAEKEAAAKYQSQNLVEKLLPVLDNFERALMVEPQHEETKQLLQGMEMVYRQLETALQNEGVQVIQATGELFDPHLHQAVMQVEEEGYEQNQIVEELQKGYQLKDRVIRHSMVKVNA